jgi:hypothetical protein
LEEIHMFKSLVAAGLAAFAVAVAAPASAAPASPTPVAGVAGEVLEFSSQCRTVRVIGRYGRIKYRTVCAAPVYRPVVRIYRPSCRTVAVRTGYGIRYVRRCY